MNSVALSLVVVGALLHALWNLCAKKASGGLQFVWLFGLVSVVVALPFGVWEWRAHPTELTGAAWIAIAASALIHVIYSLVLQKGYRESDFSIVYPLARGTGPLFSVVGAMAVLGEAPSALGWVGIFTVLLGLFLISGLAGSFHSPSERVRNGVLWGGITGLTIAAYTVVDGWAVKVLGIPPVVYYGLGLAVRTVILAPQALANRPGLRAQWRQNGRYILAVGLLSPLAYSLILHALTLSPLSYVAPVRELSMLAGVWFGAKVLREALSPARVVGAVCMVAGIVLLTRAA